MLHIIGDSHSRTFDGAKDTEIHWMGAVTALNIWKKNKEILPIMEQYPKDRYFFCFGEIDCRIHIYAKAMETGVPEYIITHNTVNTYVSYAAFLRRNYDVSVMSAPPQGVQENVYEYEFYASRPHRQEITDYFNLWLESIARDNKVPFVDIWYNKPEIVRPMFPTYHFKEDACHIKNTVAIERLEAYLENC